MSRCCAYKPLFITIVHQDWKVLVGFMVVIIVKLFDLQMWTSLFKVSEKETSCIWYITLTNSNALLYIFSKNIHFESYTMNATSHWIRPKFGRDPQIWGFLSPLFNYKHNEGRMLDWFLRWKNYLCFCCRSGAEENMAGAEQRCPIRGRHTIFTGTANCDSHFRSSCSSPDVVDIVSTCASRPGQPYNTPSYIEYVYSLRR